MIEWDAPDSAYWSIQLGTVWSRPLDSMHRQTDINMARAVLDADGRFRVVICPDDPGVPNWLDPYGNLEGTMVVRNYRDPTATTPPAVRVVKAAEPRSVLPPETPIVTPDDRRQALARRRAGARALVPR